MALIISQKIRLKLANKVPPVTQAEIEECFTNRNGRYVLDTREEHQTDPPTRWFVAETHYGRKLKVVFIPMLPNIVIRTAYDANADEIALYRKKGSW
jgi:hypothetical protein